MSTRRFRIVLTLFVSLITCVSVSAERNLVRTPGTTRYQPMMNRLRALVHESQTAGPIRMRLEDIGHSVEGRTIWLVTIWNSTVDPGAERRIFYLCRQHGHEPASTEGALAFMTELVEAPPNSPWSDCLQHAVVYIVPMANPDGAEHFLRHNAHDVDLNRDWLKQTQPETRALVSAINEIHPDVMTDQHELYPNDRRNDFTETAGIDGGASASVANMCDDLSAVVGLGMACDNDSVRPVFDNDHNLPRLAHRYASLVAGVPAILFETNRLTGSGRSVAMRAEAQEHFMENVLRVVGGERAEILAEAQSKGILGSPAAQSAPVGAPAPVPGDGENEGL